MAITTLRRIFSDIASALRRKGVDRDVIHPEEYASLIDSITVGDGLTNTEDGTAVAEDIASGKVAYVKGNRIVGNVLTITTTTLIHPPESGITSGDSAISITCRFLESVLFRPNSLLYITQNFSAFGNALKSQVLKGYTFTSSDGFRITGTYEPPESGVDTSDGTATASDIADGKIAYSKNGRIVGNIQNIAKGETFHFGWTDDFYSNGLFLFVRNLVNEDVLVRSGSKVVNNIELSDLGDATAADVASGKTFTSSAGLKVTGTASIGSSVEPNTSYVTPSNLSNSITIDLPNSILDYKAIFLYYRPLSMTSLEISSNRRFLSVYCNLIDHTATGMVVDSSGMYHASSMTYVQDSNTRITIKSTPTNVYFFDDTYYVHAL